MNKTTLFAVLALLISALIIINVFGGVLLKDMNNEIKLETSSLEKINETKFNTNKIIDSLLKITKKSSSSSESSQPISNAPPSASPRAGPGSPFIPECPSQSQQCVINKSTNFTYGDYYVPNGIKIASSGITLDCKGAILTGGNSGTGISFANGISDSKIINCTIENYSRAIDLYGYENNRNDISQSTIRNNAEGIYLSRAFENKIHDNNFTNNNKGIYLYSRAACADLSPERNRYYSNRFYGGDYAIYSYGEDGCSITTSPKYEKIENNIFYGANYSIYLTDHDLPTYFNITGNDFMSSNLYDLYLGTKSNYIWNNAFLGKVKYAYTSNNFCPSGMNNTFSENSNIQSCDCISPIGTLKVENNIKLCTNNFQSVQLSAYNPNTIIDCDNASLFGAPPNTAISSQFDNTTIRNCNIYHYQTGIFTSGIYNTITNNYFFNETYGLDIRKLDAEGADSSRHSNISNNKFERGSTGIYVAPSVNPSEPAIYQMINDNDFFKQSYGIYLGLSSYSTYLDIYQNSFRNDTRGFFGYAPNNKIRNNTFDFNRNATTLINENFTLSGNKFTNILSYAVVNRNAKNVSAISNNWDTDNVTKIAQLVFDHFDNPLYGYVLYEPFIVSGIDCNINDSWYNMSNWRNISLGECTLMQQYSQEYRDYFEKSLGVCDYAVTDSRWLNSSSANKAEGTTCNDNLFCTINDVCSSGVCSGSTRDCSANNLPGVDSCTNNPDNNPLTKDFFAGFTSTCNENNDICTSDSISLTHSCSKSQCNAECESNSDCNDNNSSTTDSCNSCSCSHETISNSVCIIRDSYTNLPQPESRENGTGYWFSRITGNDFNSVQNACTENIYFNLMQNYCNSGQTNAVQWGAAILNQISGCSQYGCGFYDCSYITTRDLIPGACVIRDSITNNPTAGNPNLGTGYAKQMMPENSIQELRNSCTTAIYNDLMQQYCNSGQTSLVQWQVSILGSSTGCASQGCEYHNC